MLGKFVVSTRSRATTAAYQTSKRHASSRIFELRQYHLKPECVGSYMKEATASSELRKSLVPLRLFSLPEVGGELNVASHLYFYEGGMKDRAAKRKVSGANEEWVSFVNQSRSGVRWQESRIYAEAPQFVLDAGNAKGGRWEGDGIDGPGVYEYRKYQLPLGYVTVPNFLEIYAEGVAEKIQHQDPTTSLCTVMYTEVGKLNEVIEVWRHSCVGGMESSRFMAREAPKWREAIGKMAEIAVTFENEIVNPVDRKSVV